MRRKSIEIAFGQSKAMQDENTHTHTRTQIIARSPIARFIRSRLFVPFINDKIFEIVPFDCRLSGFALFHAMRFFSVPFTHKHFIKCNKMLIRAISIVRETRAHSFFNIYRIHRTTITLRAIYFSSSHFFLCVHPSSIFPFLVFVLDRFFFHHLLHLFVLCCCFFFSSSSRLSLVRYSLTSLIHFVLFLVATVTFISRSVCDSSGIE